MLYNFIDPIYELGFYPSTRFRATGDNDENFSKVGIKLSGQGKYWSSTAEPSTNGDRSFIFSLDSDSTIYCLLV